MPSLLPILDRVDSPDRVSLPARSIQDQGALDACFSCAIATAIEARSPTIPPLSPAFHFHHATGGFAAASMTDFDAFTAIRKFGMASFAAHVFRDGERGSCPLTLAGIQEDPLPSAETDGAKRQFESRHHNSGFGYSKKLFASENQIKEFLHQGVAAVAIIYTNPAYWNMAVTDNQPAPRPYRLENTDSASIPSHAVCIIGCIESDSCFVVQDSRGVSFGCEGQWLLPYTAVTGFVQAVFGIYSRLF